MSDTPPDLGFAGSSRDEQHVTHSPTLAVSYPSSNPRPSGTSSPFNTQYNPLPPGALQTDFPRQQNVRSPYVATPAHDQSQHAFNFSTMANTLPDYASQPGGLQGQSHPHRQMSSTTTPGMIYQMQQAAQYSGQLPTTYSNQTSYGAGALPHGQYPPSFGPNHAAQAGMYTTFHNNPQRFVGQSPSFPSFSPNQQQYMYYGSPYTNPGPQQMQQYAAPSDSRSGLSLGAAPATFQHDSGLPSGYGGTQTQTNLRPGNIGSVPRGPPRKPKQSGHALWVGNLPPGTTVMDLKDHFSRDATKDIESLFLISKSNCAFVNYRTEQSCTAAMHRFHDSRFQGVRLVCRLRRGSTPAAGVPTGPSAMAENRVQAESPQDLGRSQEDAPNIGTIDDVDEDDEGVAARENMPILDGEESGIPSTKQVDSSTSAENVAEKFFIVKSLTLQDLELSVKNGIWTTQSHNEVALNRAFETADNVYLIFSANKSGEYFGYARMASKISEDAGDIMSTFKRADAVESTNAPRSIPTPATEFAPKGRIVDDSARGTIFWEAELSDEEEATKPAEGDLDADDTETADQAWGKPFKIEWISTQRLPFYRTRGLRNPWNANREVKIARDGTELETNVGKRLTSMFHRMTPTAPPPQNMMQAPIGPPGRSY